MEVGDWSREDRNWLLEYLEKNDTSALQQLMQEDFSGNINNGVSENGDASQKLLEFIHQKIASETRQGKVIRLALWKRIAAAAAILILLGAGAFFIFFNNNEQKPIAKTNSTVPSNDIAPGGNKAVLTLDDNSKIILDNAQDGVLTQQGNAKVVKLDDGQLSYTTDRKTTTDHVLYNTITTPRGGQYQLTLSDGSKVWLNAASSIHFPTAFVGNERKVEITGEAYFEVAPSISPEGGGKRPFIVNVAGKEEVEVLGTHFNINSYSDEASINTTLLEGSVKVTSLITHNSLLITPGEQIQLNASGQISINNNVDVEQIMAWKNGQFNFNSADVENIMRQVSRWYDVDVIYKGQISKDTYSGIVSRSSNVSEVLKIMQQGGVKFTIEGKKITVLE